MLMVIIKISVFYILNNNQQLERIVKKVAVSKNILQHIFLPYHTIEVK